MIQRTAIYVGAFAITAGLYSCGENTKPYEETILKVDYVELSPLAGVTTTVTYPGMIEGIVNVDVKAQITGYLEEIFVSEGSYVKQGQSLFRIKADVYNAQVNSSTGAYQAALAAEKNALLEVEKIRPLVEGKVYSKLQLQTAEANYAAAKAQVAQARANLGSSQVNAAFATIKAPVSGYIGRIPYRTGTLVSPGDATPLTTLSDISTVNVYFSLNESGFISLMKAKAKGDPDSADLVLADGTTYNHTGKVAFASGNIDRSTGSMAMKAVFDNPDRLLRSGGSARVILKKVYGDVLLVPMEAVKDIQDKYFVYVVTDSNTVTMKEFAVLASSNNNYILKSGLSAGEKVVVNRIDELHEGAAVMPSKCVVKSIDPRAYVETNN